MDQRRLKYDSRLPVPVIFHDGLAYLTAREMGEADKEAIEGCGIDVLSMMEDAGTAVAQVARVMLGGVVSGKKIGILAGKGNNGGDGLVAARRLRDWGADIAVVLSDAKGLGSVPAKQLLSLSSAGVVPRGPLSPLGGLDLLVDALLGYNSMGDPRSPVSEVITSANAAGTKLLAVDIPSGLDPTSGEPRTPCIRAAATVALGFPKTGFLNPDSRPYVGDLYLGDVSIPIQTYRRMSCASSPFEKEEVVRVWQSVEPAP